ncbi:hypothetical protein [Mucilaginibacter sp. PAMB04168]|uniref:hypothetical protein n=1 Tax=Mucilaginibacter sp. PAMB04168 TaxID=3138567 RepID=UPI0031F70DB1
MVVNSALGPSSQANSNEAFLSPAGGNTPYASTSSGTLKPNALQVSDVDLSVNASSVMFQAIGASAKVDLHTLSLAVNFIIVLTGVFQQGTRPVKAAMGSLLFTISFTLTF